MLLDKVVDVHFHKTPPPQTTQQATIYQLVIAKISKSDLISSINHLD